MLHDFMEIVQMYNTINVPEKGKHSFFHTLFKEYEGLIVSRSL